MQVCVECPVSSHLTFVPLASLSSTLVSYPRPLLNLHAIDEEEATRKHGATIWTQPKRSKTKHMVTSQTCTVSRFVWHRIMEHKHVLDSLDQSRDWLERKTSMHGGTPPGLRLRTTALYILLYRMEAVISLLSRPIMIDAHAHFIGTILIRHF